MRSKVSSYVAQFFFQLRQCILAQLIPNDDVYPLWTQLRSSDPSMHAFFANSSKPAFINPDLSQTSSHQRGGAMSMVSPNATFPPSPRTSQASPRGAGTPAARRVLPIVNKETSVLTGLQKTTWLDRGGRVKRVYILNCSDSTIYICGEADYVLVLCKEVTFRSAY